MKINILKQLSVIMMFLICLGCAGKKSSKTVEVYSGASIPGIGISIEASYDPRLDNLASGYKVLNVAMVNDSFNIIGLDPKRDKWWVRTSQTKNKKYPVICDLGSADSAAWRSIPSKARKHIGYPYALPIGGRQVVDLFVKDDVPLEDFTEVIIYFSRLKKTVRLLPRLE